MITKFLLAKLRFRFNYRYISELYATNEIETIGFNNMGTAAILVLYPMVWKIR